MIHVLATIEIAPGQRDAFLAEFHQIVPQVHAEDGCIEYGPAVDAVTDIGTQRQLGADTVVIIEKWESVAALKAHSVAPLAMHQRFRQKRHFHRERALPVALAAAPLGHVE